MVGIPSLEQTNKRLAAGWTASAQDSGADPSRFWR